MIISDTIGLTRGSNKKVLSQCDYCGAVISKRYADAIRHEHHFCNHTCCHHYQRKVAWEHLDEVVGGSFKDWLYEKYIVEKLSTSQIAVELGFTGHQAVVDWLRVFDIPVRTWGECRTGELSPNYNPNLTDEERIARRDTKEDIHFKQSVFKRDDYTCQKCNQRGKRLNAHHLLNYKDYPDSRYDTSNGVTLCENCHIQFHRRYGYRNNTIEQILEYLE